MTAPGNDLLFLVLTLSILLSSAYAVGRIHQWHKYSLERDDAYRLGYDEASLSIIKLMAEQRTLAVADSATVTPLAALPHARRSGRHTRGRSGGAALS
jgi:hypothetical protein